VDDVCQWLRLVWTNEFEQLFRHMNVNGKVLMQLDDRQSVENMLHLSTDQSAWVAAFVSSLKVAVTARHSEVNIDSFRIVKQIGEGAFGQVWLGRRKGTNKIYAIKSLDKVGATELPLRCAK
jgi:serine/threonine protein kinase